MDRLAEVIYASLGRLLLISLAVGTAAAAAGGMDAVRALAAIGAFWICLEVFSGTIGDKRP